MKKIIEFKSVGAAVAKKPTASRRSETKSKSSETKKEPGDGINLRVLEMLINGCELAQIVDGTTMVRIVPESGELTRHWHWGIWGPNPYGCLYKSFFCGRDTTENRLARIRVFLQVIDILQAGAGAQVVGNRPVLDENFHRFFGKVLPSRGWRPAMTFLANGAHFFGVGVGQKKALGLKIENGPAIAHDLLNIVHGHWPDLEIISYQVD